jgi:hypothetical protein
MLQTHNQSQAMIGRPSPAPGAHPLPSRKRARTALNGVTLESMPHASRDCGAIIRTMTDDKVKRRLITVLCADVHATRSRRRRRRTETAADVTLRRFSPLTTTADFGVP